MFKKARILLTIFLTTIIALNSVASGLGFTDKAWEEVKYLAMIEDYNILLVLHNTRCDACNSMQNVYRSYDTKDALSDLNYIAKVLNYSNATPPFKQRFPVTDFPAYFILDAKGNPLHAANGKMSSKAFEALLKTYNQPEKQLFTQEKAFEKGQKDADFLYNYIQLTVKADALDKKAVTQYELTQTDADWPSAKNWQLITSVVETSDERLFQKVLFFRDTFNTMIGREKVDNFIQTVYINEAQSAARKNKQALDILKQRYKRQNPYDYPKLAAMANYYFYKKHPDVELVHRYTKKYMDTLCNNWSELDDASNLYYKLYTSSSKLRHALNWVSKSMVIDKNPANTTTYAHILYKLGRNSYALKACQEAMDMAAGMGQSTKSCERLYHKILAER